LSLISITRKLCSEVERLRFGPPVTHVYNPLVYARAAHEQYLERYGSGKGRVVLLGMNPGPFGMAQTGVPFGEVTLVRDWLGIEARIGKPTREHPKRPILGFDCKRSEVSGARLWGFARDRFETPARFFDRFFIVNYCPLVFMEETGKNRTPDALPERERTPLLEVCDRALAALVDELEPKLVVGVGAFAEKRAKIALESRSMKTGCILHPSPANPEANRAWTETVTRQLAELGVRVPDGTKD
jgi:single-strand selective monofunctional uracil DNA glycosylase